MGKRTKKNLKADIISTFMLIVFFVLFVISSVEIIKWYINNKKNQDLNNKISQAITMEETDENSFKYNVNFKELKEKNNDVVAWLKVEETNIEYVVVKSENNEYYLDHNFDKEYNNAGWVFADYKNKFDGTDKNIVIYGHNRRDGSMFGTLENVLKEEWYLKEENRKITFITENENSIYEVFSAYQITNEDYYIKNSFKNKEFSEYIETVKNRSITDFNIEVTQEDELLTLSTCADNNKYRVALHARKLK